MFPFTNEWYESVVSFPRATLYNKTDWHSFQGLNRCANCLTAHPRATPIVISRGFHRGFQKGFHFQNESCDCIKYLNLGDPCCGSGGMFVQSAKFVENHSGNINNIAIYGEDSNPTTWKMAQMNLAMLTASLFFM